MVVRFYSTKGNKSGKFIILHDIKHTVLANYPTFYITGIFSKLLLEIMDDNVNHVLLEAIIFWLFSQ